MRTRVIVGICSLLIVGVMIGVIVCLQSSNHDYIATFMFQSKYKAIGYSEVHISNVESDSLGYRIELARHNVETNGFAKIGTTPVLISVSKIK